MKDRQASWPKEKEVSFLDDVEGPLETLWRNSSWVIINTNMIFNNNLHYVEIRQDYLQEPLVYDSMKF